MDVEERNQKYLDMFSKWLEDKGLVAKTIRKHIGNVDTYINYYLPYYEDVLPEEGYSKLDGYFDDFFVRKCMWSTPYTMKETIASLKKFYECLKDNGYITLENYNDMCEEIKNTKDIWIEVVSDYNDNLDDCWF